MNSGHYDRQLQMQRGGERDTGLQTLHDDWQDLGPLVPARHKPGVGKERFANAENSATAPGVFWFRYLPELADLNPKDRLVDQSTTRTWEIKSVKWDGNVNSEVEVTATLGVD